MHTQSLAGAIAETEFLRRLLTLGHSVIMRPAVVDDGVDYCVFTSRGWVGIQVKTAQQKKKNRHGNTRALPQYALKLSHEEGTGGKERYVRRGVSVFAVYKDGGFFLIPVEDITGERSKNLTMAQWERWSEVIGDPVNAEAESTPNTVEQLAMAWK
jgi:hypothetical protein